jgi:hypothetical protein
MDSALITTLARRARLTFDEDRARGAMGETENIGKLFAEIEAKHGRSTLVEVIARWREMRPHLVVDNDPLDPLGAR